jgi:hypothetical protein
VDALPGILQQLALYVFVVLTFLGPIEAFLRFRLRRATHRGDPHAYLPATDPWVTVVVALAGAGTMVLASVLS